MGLGGEEMEKEEKEGRDLCVSNVMFSFYESCFVRLFCRFFWLALVWGRLIPLHCVGWGIGSDRVGWEKKVLGRARKRERKSVLNEMGCSMIEMCIWIWIHGYVCIQKFRRSGK